MEKEKSEDSYCTTDEGGKDNKDENQEEVDIPITEKVGDIEKIIKEAVKKEIIQVGNSKNYPSDIDNIVVEYKCYLQETNELIDFSDGRIEIDLSEKKFPEGFLKSIMKMRKNESARIYTRPKYAFLNYNEDSDLILPKGYESGEKLEFLKKSYLIYEVTVYDWFVVQVLMDNQEIKKKIIVNGTKWVYPKLSDIVTYSLSLFQDNIQIYSKTNITEEIDKVEYYEIEKRAIQNCKYGEKAEIKVKANYLKDRNLELAKAYNLNLERDILFICEIHDIKQYEYIYNIEKDKYSKKHILSKGFRTEMPDRDSLVKIRLQIFYENEKILDDFGLPIGDYLNQVALEKNQEKFEQLITANNLQDVELAENLENMKSIYNKIDFINSTEFDLKVYDLPLIMRKLLVHMKRDEIVELHTRSVDYFYSKNTEIYEKKGHFVIYCHLLDFLNRPSFSKYTYSEKNEELNKLKLLANSLFKENKIYRASKIYNNINYRFNYGDVFGSSSDKNEEKLKETDSNLAKSLADLRLSSLLNYSNCKFKLKKFASSFETASNILNLIDQNNLKALFVKGKSAIELKKFDIAVEVFSKLTSLSDNEEFKASYENSKQLLQDENNKKKNLYKKMIFN